MLYFMLIYVISTYPFIRKIQNKKMVIFLELFPIFLILAFQQAIGTDYYNYIRIFNQEVIFSYSRGPLFKVLVLFLKNIFNNERSLFITIAAIQMILFYKIIDILYEKKFIKDISLFVFLSISVTGFYFRLFNTLRSSIACLFIVISLLYLLENNLKKSFLLMILGSGFHPSVFIWNIIFLMKNMLYKKLKINRIMTFILICFLLNKLNFIPNLAKIIYESEINIPYRSYLISKHMFPYIKSYGVGTIINIIIFIYSLYIVYKNEINKEKIFLYNIGYLFFSLGILFSNIPIFSRLLEGGNLFISYIIYNLIEKLLEKRISWGVILFIIYYVLVFIRSSFLLVPAF